MAGIFFDAVFAADVEADYPGTMHWYDLASFTRDFAKYHEALENHQHVMTNHQVVVDGDAAYSLTYGTYRLVEKASGNDSAGVREGRCWYDDEFKRTNAGWRISRRVARVFWARGTAPRRAVIAGTDNESEFSEQPSMNSLFVEARAGRVSYFNALRRLQPIVDRTFKTGIVFDMRAPDFGTEPSKLYAAAFEMIAYADQHGIGHVNFPRASLLGGWLRAHAYVDGRLCRCTHSEYCSVGGSARPSAA